MKSVACVLVVVMGCASSGGKRAGIAVGAFTAAAGLAIMASAEDSSCGEDEDFFNDNCGIGPSSGAMTGGLLLGLGLTIAIIAAVASADEPIPDVLAPPPPPPPFPAAAASSRFPARPTAPPPPPPPVE